MFKGAGLAWLILAVGLLRPGAADPPLEPLIVQVAPQVVSWRRDLHQHPELSNREFETSALVARELRQMGLRVQTGVAGTGVVGYLEGPQPGPVIALRADMDALPLEERSGLPFASRARSSDGGVSRPVMHACGHDAHVAILLGTARVLSQLRPHLKGSVRFLFQPAEEGPPQGERGGAALMIEQGVMDQPPVEVIFGLHVAASLPSGDLGATRGLCLASDDRITLRLTLPPGGDAVVVTAQLIAALQSLVASQTDLARSPAVLTFGRVEGKGQAGLAPREVRVEGTLRCLDQANRRHLQQALARACKSQAQAYGAEVEVEIENLSEGVVNDPYLLEEMLPLLKEAAAPGKYHPTPVSTASEDFSCYTQRAPGLFFYLGVCPLDQKPGQAPPHHSSEFRLDDSHLEVGVRAFCHLVLGYSRLHPDGRPDLSSSGVPRWMLLMGLFWGGVLGSRLRFQAEHK